MDPADGLIAAGDETSQLTWMDAKRDGVVFTPRHGKAVEINALWHHGLVSLAEVVEKDDAKRAAEMRLIAGTVATSFRAKFWNSAKNCCHDVLLPGPKGAWKPDTRLRPNQVFAASLRHSPLEPERRRHVVAFLKGRLLTPMGLRTLEPVDPGYKPRYRGTMWDRDAAYHNGTVWPWLLGPYAEAVLRAGEFSTSSRLEALGVLARSSRGSTASPSVNSPKCSTPTIHRRIRVGRAAASRRHGRWRRRFGCSSWR
jgi:predicted glycogen debranching enzyme